jgi:hypothetical protein
MIDNNFILGFSAGMVTCIGAASVLIIYACCVIGARADKRMAKMRESD